jgi:uncharacterized membrane protein YvbJ
MSGEVADGLLGHGGKGWRANEVSSKKRGSDRYGRDDRHRKRESEKIIIIITIIIIIIIIIMIIKVRSCTESQL